MIIQGDSLHELKELTENSVDTIITDPPYGYSFMGKDWDKAVPNVEIWQECLRVLKPGAFMCVMSAPRCDVQCAMISRLVEAGFRLDFTPIYWTYASGFPKAMNMGKAADIVIPAAPGRKAVSAREMIDGKVDSLSGWHKNLNNNDKQSRLAESRENGFKTTSNTPATDQAKALDGSYAGFQPKPAVEVIIVAMKPLSEKTYVDQALANGHGVSWLDDARIPTDEIGKPREYNPREHRENWRITGGTNGSGATSSEGRFPANLLITQSVLGEYSKFFDLDKWEDKQKLLNAEESAERTHDSIIPATLPFLIVPKASKGEKNKGLEHLPKKHGMLSNSQLAQLKRGEEVKDNLNKPGVHSNHHPTVKPLKLMSYLITLFSRPGDTVLDPFVGSGTTVVAAKQLGREGIGIEREAEYAEIARARLHHVMPQLPAEKPEPGEPPVTVPELLGEKPTQVSLF